ncbi:MAG TPA: hypothetical protein VFR37_08095 [Longimicrobium sp.]|nr:hypothetical protein [Longimicrobium sp.]
MDDRPIDLSPLDPDEDPRRRDRVVGGAMMRVRALQRTDEQPWTAWLRWWRPTVAFAAVTMAVSGAVLASAGRPDNAAWSSAAAGVPQPVAGWMSSGGLPSAAEVYAAVQGYR